MSSGGAKNAATIPLADVLARLDDAFSEFSLAIAQDQYAFWLGSGISFGQMPSLKALIRKMLSHLQSHADLANETCAIQVSLKSVLALATLGPEEAARTDISQPSETWPDIDVIAQRLAGRYAEVLDQNPTGHPEDYLLWDAVKVTDVYADPAVAPGAEHYAIAALTIEGVASKIASANWDGLVEKALNELDNSAAILRVNVIPEDTQKPDLRSALYKFHGCASAAKADPDKYRDKLVARKSQIDGWAEKNPVIAAKLIDLARSNRTLMLGLSAQDTNIQDIFIRAKGQMAWAWPSHPPAYVFSEAEVGSNQKGLLKNVYREQYAANESAILDSALIPTFAAPLLVGLWLKVIELKLCLLISMNGAVSPLHKEALQAGLKKLRDSAANICGTTERLSFLKTAFGRMQIVLKGFREGSFPKTGEPGYSALSSFPHHQMAADPQLQPSGMIPLAIALGLVGTGEVRGHWTVTVPDISKERPGSIQLAGDGRLVQVFFADSDHTASRMLADLVHDNDDALILVSHEVASPMARNPRPTLGRTGTAQVQKLSVTELLNTSPDPEIALRAIRESVGL